MFETNEEEIKELKEAIEKLNSRKESNRDLETCKHWLKELLIIKEKSR